MSEEGAKYAGTEEIMFQLLAGGGKNMEQGNLLIMLSLVNLMGIINIISHKMGVKPGVEARGAGVPEAGREDGGRGEAPEKKAPPVDPATLLSMLHYFMPPPGGQPQGPVAGEPAKEKSVAREDCQ